MAALPLTSCDELLRDTGLVEEVMQAGISHHRDIASNTYWKLWESFRKQLDLAPYFTLEEYPIPWLQIFCQRVRDGRAAANGQPVQSGTVAVALLFIAQAHTWLGAPDSRHVTHSRTLVCGNSVVMPNKIRPLLVSNPSPSQSCIALKE